MNDIHELRNAAVATLEAMADKVRQTACASQLATALQDAEAALEAQRQALLTGAEAPPVYWDVDVME